MRTEINLKVTFRTPFVVGTGAMTGSDADKPTAKDANHRPIIPASALKGRLRHRCEALIRALADDQNAVCHGPAAEQMCPLDPDRLDRWPEVCPICQIFGGPGRPGALTFSDLHWALADEWPGNDQPPPTDIRYGVSIRRARRVAEPQRLFTLETFGPATETVYTGRIVGYFPDQDDDRYWRVALVLGGLRLIHALGGGRSRGLGWCQIDAQAYDVLDGDRFDIETEMLQEALRQWLL